MNDLSEFDDPSGFPCCGGRVFCDADAMRSKFSIWTTKCKLPASYTNPSTDHSDQAAQVLDDRRGERSVSIARNVK
jgi:hypothetical protein